MTMKPIVKLFKTNGRLYGITSHSDTISKEDLPAEIYNICNMDASKIDYSQVTEGQELVAECLALPLPARLSF